MSRAPIWMVLGAVALLAAGLSGCGGGGEPIGGLDSLTDGNAAFLQGDYSRAISSFNDALESNPGLHEAYNNLALCYLALGQTDQAVRYMQTAISTGAQPQAAVKMNRATILQARGDLAGAVSQLEAVAAASGSWNLRAQIAYNLGLLYDEQGNTQKAKDQFEQALSLAGVGTGEPSRTDNRVWQKATAALAVEWAKLGDRGRAIGLLQTVLNVSQVSPEAQRAAQTDLAALGG